MAMGQKEKTQRGPQILGCFFCFPLSVFWVCGIFDPRPHVLMGSMRFDETPCEVSELEAPVEDEEILSMSKDRRWKLSAGQGLQTSSSLKAAEKKTHTHSYTYNLSPALLKTKKNIWS